MTYIIFVTVAFFSSIIGAICGIGGGVIIKPVLDMVGILDVKTINFLSGCTVLAMSTYSIVMAKVKRESLVEWKTATPLAVGAAVGGLLGKEIFQIISQRIGERAGAIQAICLIIMTVGTLLYTLKKEHIRTYHLVNIAVCVVVGLILGIASSFLGIGGGPINLVVLFFLFSMRTKTAAQNSLYIILFSQLASLCSTLVTNSVPNVNVWLLMLMIVGGIMGGFFGRKINKKIDSQMVDKLFIGLMIVIILINIYNVFKFASM